ncbi:MAG: hypothetical protein K6G15_01120 [Desulfovibrio sp.]|nr:hypothetical protein [Desulfovibrio sp.]
MAGSAESIDDLLGQEFLTWLWCKSDLAPDGFVDSKGEKFSVSMEQRIVVAGGNGDARETASVTGVFSPLSEARFGLGTGKKVVRALLHLEKDGAGFQCVLKAQDFSLSGLRTPKIEKSEAADDDPDALLLEKIDLIESCLDLLDSLFKSFLDVRLSEAWAEEVFLVRQWLSKTAG